MVLRQLLRQGFVDSLIQVAATTMVRLGLVLSLLVLAPLIPLEETGQFDLFIVGVTFVQLAVTAGMDSGLAIVNQSNTLKMRRLYLIVSLTILCALALFGYLVVGLAMLALPILKDYAELIRIGLVYGTAMGTMILIFSWFRWQSRARTASMLLISVNIASFAFAAVSFILFKTIFAFMSGLCLGSVGGVALCVSYLIRFDGFSLSNMREISDRNLMKPVAIDLLLLSMPYLFASISLVLRRLVDRSYILTLGDPHIIGAYAIIARASELIAFAFALPSVGFAPILMARYQEASAQHLGRLIYTGYVVLAFLIVLAALFVSPWFFAFTDDTTIAALVPLATSIIAGTLFLGETSIAAFGYLLVRKPSLFTAFSVAYIVAYAVCIIVLSAFGFGIAALGWSFIISSLLFSTVAVKWSEKFVCFGYPLKAIHMVKLATACVAALQLLSL
jgi:O-antigen/teichoic acid export membrane protein